MGGIQHNQATMLTRENCKGSDLAGFEYFSGWPLHFAKDIFHLYAAAQLGVGGSGGQRKPDPCSKVCYFCNGAKTLAWLGYGMQNEANMKNSTLSI